jgi:hypothetical protein
VSLRDSLDLIRMVRPEAGTAALEHEIAAERASSLGAAERQVRATLARLSETGLSNPPALAAAQRAVWAYFVQRELIGFRNHREIINDLKIPPQVLAGLGTARSLKRS